MTEAVFFDIDGTLLAGGAGALSPGTRRALNRLRAQGIKLFIATGRCPQLVGHIQEILDFPFDGYLMMNGQYCVAGETPVYKQALSRETVEGLLPYAARKGICCSFVGLDSIHLYGSPTELAEEQRFAPMTRQLSLEAPLPFSPEEIYQIWIKIPPEGTEELLAQVPDCRLVYWNPALTDGDLIPKSGGKARGIEKMLAHFGISKAHAMAFGDGDNDREMLQYVGLGVAMGNALPSLKAVADHVTGSVLDNGIYDACVKFGLFPHTPV